MNFLAKASVAILLFVTAWVLVEMWLLRIRNQKRARDMADRSAERRLHEAVFGKPERRAASRADAFVQQRQDEMAE